MTRIEFIKNCAVLGIGTPFFTSLITSCTSGIDFFEDFEVNFSGKVLIIGAGAAGLTAGHVLKQHNIEFEILEASGVHGGRVKKTDDFADFPIDLGAEWIHTDPAILAKLLNDPSQTMTIEPIIYSPESMYFWNDGKLQKRNFFSNFYGEYKFKHTTWYDFFEQYIVPGIRDQITYNSPVTEIDYTGDKVYVRNVDGDLFEADKVIVTVPLPILQNDSITFQPALPAEKVNALTQVDVPPGIKVFIEFSEKFYPDIVSIGGVSSAGEEIFYDAAFRKDTQRNVLALFSVGDQAGAYTNLDTEEEIINLILSQLDEMFEGKASETYMKHIIQNWSKEPFIQGSYSHYGASEMENINTLAQAIDNKVYFAGEAYTYESSSTVHGAGESAYVAVEALLSDGG